MRPSLIKIAAWSELYVNKFLNYLEPILSTQNNLPALCNLSPTKVMIYTNNLSLQPFRNIAHENLSLQICPVQADENVHHNRQILAQSDELSIQHAAENDADWFDFQADTIVDDSYLSTLKRYLLEYDSVLTCSFRMHLEKYNEIVPKGLVPDAKSLYNVALLAMHPNTLKYFVTKKYSIIPADPHQFFFANGNGFNGRTWQPRPAAFRASKIAKGWGHGIDVHIVSRIDWDKAYFQTELPGDFYHTSTDIEQPSFGKFPVTTDMVLRSINNMAKSPVDLANYRKALQIQYKFTNPENLPIPLPTDCLNESEIIQDLLLFSMGHKFEPTWKPTWP